MIRALLVAIFVIFSPALLLSQEPPKQPNIVVILVDDMGYSDLGCYGSEIRTPNLDRLAAGGVRFTQFYNTARCCPTRASLLTGLYPHQAGVGHMVNEQKGADGKVLPGYSGRLNDRCVTIAEVLRGAGYFTAMAGKWHVGQNHGVTPSGRGFERSLNAPAGGFYYPDSARAELFLDGKKLDNKDPALGDWYTTDLWTKYGLKFVDEAQAAKKPFFLYVAHNAPHFPLQAPPADIARWRGKFKAGWDKLRKERHDRQVEMGLVDRAWELAPRPDGVPAWESLSAEQQDRYDHLMAIYAAVLERMDQSVGTLVDGLKERGQLDNTLILFMSDNGGNAESGVPGKMVGNNPGDAKSDVFVGECWAGLNNTPFVRYKHFTDEGGIATPLIAHWPKGIPESRKGALEKQPGHLIDIMATCVDVAGAKYPERFKDQAINPPEGVSLRPAFAGEELKRRQPLFWEHEGNRAVRDGKWKLVALAGKPWRLYDLQADRTEQHNLADANPARVKELTAKWDEYAARANVLPLGGWRGLAANPNQSVKLSQERLFKLKEGDHLERAKAPAIVKQNVSITASFAAPKADGVIVAQGGNSHGYALFVQDGKLTFLVRVANKATSIAATAALAGKQTAVASLASDGAMSLSVDGKVVAKGKTPAPLVTMPTDGLDVGSDQGGLVGPYPKDNRFQGEIESVVIELGSKSER